MNYPENTPSSLIMQCKNHDPKGWERVKFLYEKLVIYWCRQQNVPTADLQDIFQDTILRAMANIDGFQKGAEGSTFRGWLRRVAYSRIMDYYRARKTWPVAWNVESTPDSDALENEHEREVLLDRLVCVTPEEETTELSIVHNALRDEMSRVFSAQSLRAFELMVFHQWTSREVAEELGMTPSAVRQIKSRIMQWARNALGEGDAPMNEAALVNEGGTPKS